MNDVTIFRKDEFGAVRAVTLKGEPWFVAADVCRALGLGNSSMAISSAPRVVAAEADRLSRLMISRNKLRLRLGKPKG